MGGALSCTCQLFTNCVGMGEAVAICASKSSPEELELDWPNGSSEKVLVVSNGSGRPSEEANDGGHPKWGLESEDDEAADNCGRSATPSCFTHWKWWFWLWQWNAEGWMKSRSRTIFWRDVERGIYRWRLL